jgi:hypothetical protein
LLAAAAFAQDAQLGTLRATMATLHSHAAAAAADFKTRGGSPELTVAKHQLRDWIETQLGSLKDFGEEQAFAARINEALKAVDATNTGDDQNFLGSVGDVRVSSESGLLIITTGVGILCEYDESAYGYKREDGRWQRIWKSEHNDYSDKYAPQNVIAVHVLQTFKDGHENGPAFVMTLGNDGGCASSWRTVYYRVWRVDSVGSKLLIDEAEFAWFRAETYSVGSIIQDWRDKNAPVDVLVEFTERSVDAAVHNREAIRHFLIDGDRVRRIDPVALSPRDFVDEWLTQNWNASATWSASPMMQQWHRRLHADFVAGHFSDVTMHCQTPDLWQVTFQPKNAQKNFEPEPKVYFLVRWRPPYHFTMVNVVDKPWPLCTQEDREADEWRTLFSTQEWRR